MDLGLFGGWERMVSVAVKGVVFYCYAIFLLRVSGKRTMARMTVFDFVSTVAMATITGSTIVSSSVTLSDGVAGLTTLVGLQWLVAWLSARNERFYRLITDQPRLLFDGSRFIEENLRRERVNRDDVKAQIRRAGHPNLESVGAVVLETTGEVAVLSSSVPEKPAEPDEQVVGPVRR